MAKKKSAKKPDEQKKSTITASHLMLYIILGVYITVALAGIVFIGMCIGTSYYESGAQALIGLFSFSGICGSSVTIAYTTKATKENEIKISNDKYRMRLEIAKEIFAEYGTSLDDKSVDLLRKLMSDEGINEIAPAMANTNNNLVSGFDIGTVTTIDSNRIDSEGVG